MIILAPNLYFYNCKLCQGEPRELILEFVCQAEKKVIVINFHEVSPEHSGYINRI